LQSVLKTNQAFAKPLAQIYIFCIVRQMLARKLTGLQKSKRRVLLKDVRETGFKKDCDDSNESHEKADNTIQERWFWMPP
jgi:hypothetical protein